MAETALAEPELDSSRFNVAYDDSAAPRPTSYATADAPSSPSLTQSLADLHSLSGMENSVGEGAPDETVDHVDKSLAYANAARQAADYNVEFGIGRQTAMADAIDIKNQAIKAATGVDLENPLRGGYGEEAQRQATAQPIDPNDDSGFARIDVAAQKIAAQIYQQKLDELDAKNGDDPAMQAVIGAKRPIVQDASGVANYATYAAQKAYEASGGGVLPTVAGFLGEQVANLRDPISDVALLVGPGESAAKSTLGKIVDTAVKYGLISGGLTAAGEPSAQSWNEERGLDHGFAPAINDVADSMLGGFLMSAGIHGTKIGLARLFRGGAPQTSIDDFIAAAQKAQGVQAGTARGAAWRQEIDDFLKQQEAAQGGQKALPAPGQEAASAPEGAAAAAPAIGEPTQLPGAVQEPTPEGAIVPPHPVNGAPVPAEPEGTNGTKVPPVAGEAPVSRETPAISPSPVAKPGAPALDPIDRARITMAETDAAVAPPRLPGADPHDMLAAYGDAVRHGEDPEHAPPPLPAIAAPAATEPPVIAPDVPYSPTPGYSFEKNGRPVTFGSFDVRNIGTDAAAMQYKGGGDASGVTNRLQGVKKWDPMASGKSVLFEREDGSMIVADGHQRLGLGKLLSSDGAKSAAPINLDGYLFKASDGWTAQEVRAIAAKKNIMEGSGDALDTARVLRESPEIWDDSLPVTDGKLKQARGLADLSDPAWGMALNGLVPPNYAALVGRAMPDKSKHIAVMGDLAKFKPANENEARLMIADANAAGFATEVQQSLFGMEEATRSLVRERGQVYSAALEILRTDRKVFATLDREAARIEAEGNVLVASNASRADRAGQLGQMLETLATRSGPVSAALNRAAAEVANGALAPKKAARQFVDNLMDLIEQEGVKIIPDAMAPAVPAPALKAETPADRAAQTQTLEANARAAPQGIYDDVLEKLRNTGMPEDQALANAAVVAARYETRALRLGLEADEARDLYRAEGLQIRRAAPELEEQGLMFAQAGRAFEQPVTVPPFYSAVARAVANAKQAKASPDQWLATIRNTAGVKQDELDWMGLPDWLKSHDGPVTRDQVDDFVRANAIDIQEVGKGFPPGPLTDHEQVALESAAAKISLPLNEARPSDIEFWRRENIITPEEAAALLHNADIRYGDTAPTKYPGYTLHGGENYRELLLTLPEAKPEVSALVAAHNKLFTLHDQLRAWDTAHPDEDHPTSPERLRLVAARNAAGREHDALVNSAKARDYKSAHWDEPNILAHIRFDDRTIDGQKALHIAEVQSDWHQEGRKKGYRQPIPENELAQAIEKLHDLERELNAMHSKRDTGEYIALKIEADELRERIVGRSGVPDAPFKTSWPELSMKRVLRYATENGYDRVTWDTGATNADRYDLGKQVDEVVYYPNTNDLQAFKDGKEVMFRRDVTVDKLPDMIGKEAADKIVNNPTSKTPAKEGGFNHTLSGVDLKVGESGMTGFYDRILPTAVNKLVKKFGAKVDRSSVSGKARDTDEIAPDAQAVADHSAEWDRLSELIRPIDEAMNRVYNPDERRALQDQRQPLEDQRDQLHGRMVRETLARNPSEQIPVHSLELTPALKDAAMQEGFALFHGGHAEPRGRITLLDNRAIVHLFEQANASTFMHEAGHLWLDELARDARRDDAPAGVKEDLDTVLKWLGADKAEDVGRDGHEQWATAFERYLAEGAAPSARLAGVFEKFKLWLRQIYARLLDIARPIPKEIKGVFDRMLASDEEMAARRGEAPKPDLAAMAAEIEKSRADLLAKIDAGAPMAALESHPLVAGAKHAQTQIPRTNEASGYLSPAWKKNRLFNFDGGPVKGYKAATDRLLAVARAYSTDGPVRQERRAYIVIGPPAAGKSTLSEHIARLEHAAIIDNDDAKKALPEYAGGLGANAVHEESSDLSREVLKKAVSNGDNIVIPKIGQNTKGIGMLTDALKAVGYEVHLANLHVAPEIAFGRMIRRFIGTGRLIDPGYFHSIGDKPQQTFAALSGDERIASHADIDGEGPIHEPARVVSGAGRLADLFGGVAGPRRAGVDQIHPDASGSGGAAPDEGGQATLGEIVEQVAQLTPEEIRDGVEKIAAEAGAEGLLQNLIPGVAPVTDAERLGARAAKPLRGGHTPMPAGGLFDAAATQQMDLLTMMRQAQRAPRKAASLFDAVPVADSEDGKDMAPVDRQALLDQIPLQTALAKFVDDCQL